MLGFGSPQIKQQSGGASFSGVQSSTMTGLQVIQDSLDLTTSETTLLKDGWLAMFEHCTLDPSDVHKLASLFLEDNFYGY